MKLTVNGQQHDSKAATLAALLSELGYKDAVVATALNGEFIPADTRSNIKVEDQDRIEILAPMKGG